MSDPSEAPEFPPAPAAPRSLTAYRENFGPDGRFVLPWDPDHRVRQCIEAGGAISATEANWLLAELDRLHELEHALLDHNRGADRLAAALATARATDPRGKD